MNNFGTKTAVFTIASKNYFAFVRTLMQSLEESNPHMDRFAAVVDELDSEFVSLPRNFELLEIDQLNLPHPNQMKFRYSIMELNTAVKPFVFLKLFQKYDRVIYLDPDIFVYRRLEPVEEALEEGNHFVFTPHFNELFEEDGMQPDEPAIMRAGIYNLGFLALNKCEDTIGMLNWWSHKLEKTCVNEQSQGIFVDQKWMDLVPGYYDNVRILRHSGLNVAYWNLSHRKLKRTGGGYEANGEPLIFFHFSGFNPNKIDTISKYQNRYRLSDLGDGAELFKQYAGRVLANEFDLWKKFHYSFASYTDGRAVLDEHRAQYRNNKQLQGYCGENPFEYADIFYKDRPMKARTGGVNLLGYINSEHGLGEAARLTAVCLDAVSVPWCGYDFEVGNSSRKGDYSYRERVQNYINYNVSLININADQFKTLREHVPGELWDTYRIGIWYWELPELPGNMSRAFADVDEIWAPTQFIADCLRKYASCPVYHMPPGLYREDPKRDMYTRRYFGLPEDAFLFLNMFDIYSFAGRKNPEAALKAFQEAFAPDDLSVGLVLKLNNSRYEDQVKIKLENMIGDYQNVYVIPKVMTRDEVNSLIDCCDAAVSLHRSEGLGLLCEESMAFGKPVIATAFSGNLDFMSFENSCLVDYKSVAVGTDMGPYEAWQTWADPDIKQASRYMKLLKRDPSYYRSVSEAARETIRDKFSPEVCGQRMKTRLLQIRKLLQEGYRSDKRAKNEQALAAACVGYYQTMLQHPLTEKERKTCIENFRTMGPAAFGEFQKDLLTAGWMTEPENGDFIRSVYQLLLDRSARDNEIDSWKEFLYRSEEIQKARIDMLNAVMGSREFLGDLFEKYRPKETVNTMSVLNRQLIALNESWQNPYYFDLNCTGLKFLIKRALRKANLFLLKPITERQQQFNAQVVRCVNEMNERLRRLE